MLKGVGVYSAGGTELQQSVPLALMPQTLRASCRGLRTFEFQGPGFIEVLGPGIWELGISG